jgi:hypothetical protein
VFYYPAVLKGEIKNDTDSIISNSTLNYAFISAEVSL